MASLDIFGDDRKIPKITVNVKVKLKDLSNLEISLWNKAFGYIMRKPHSKLEFLSIDSLRSLKISEIKFDQIKAFLSTEDLETLSIISDIFDNKISVDLKIFILAMLKIPVSKLLSL